MMFRWPCTFEGSIRLPDLLSALDLSKARALELIRPLLDDEPSDELAINRFASVCWSSLLEPGDKIARRLINRMTPTIALAEVSRCIEESDLKPVQKLAAKVDLEPDSLLISLERWRLRFSPKTFRTNFETLARLGARVIADDQVNWPNGFSLLGEAEPVVLYLLGNGSPALFERSVAIVGSRVISPYGRWVTKEFCETLVAELRPVVSGGALGVDSVAHQTTLNASGDTIAIMAGGFDFMYPRGNEPLFAEIRKTGLICTEMATGFSPTKWRFLQRNRLIAAASQATVVVEAGYRSGSISTANHAAAIGRPVGAVPGPIGASHSAGCHRIIRENNAALLGSNENLRSLVNPELEALPAKQELSDEQLRVFDALGSRSSTEQRIAVRAGVGIRECQLVLAQLEIEGLVARNADKWRRIGRNLRG